MSDFDVEESVIVVWDCCSCVQGYNRFLLDGTQE